MKRIGLIAMAGVAALVGACTTDSYGYEPYYGPSQGYAYPAGYGYYPSRPYYRGYGYGPNYYSGYGSGPSITLTLPAGSIP